MPKDLIVLTADKNTEYGIRGLLSRPASFGVRSIQLDIFVHPHHDPGCAREAQDFLRPFLRYYRHALVMFDRVGSGRETLSAEVLSAEVRGRIAASGWGDRAEVIVLDPEIEVWVFPTSGQVERCLEWPAGSPKLRRWLETRGQWQRNHSKPSNPKEAFELALRELKKARSSAIYRRLGEHVSPRGCTDPAFLKFSSVIAKWFPAEDDD
jgi:hypothetical protein